MADFQEVGVQIGYAFDEALFRLETCVSGQQRTTRPEPEHGNDRILIDIILALGKQRTTG